MIKKILIVGTSFCIFCLSGCQSTLKEAYLTSEPGEPLVIPSPLSKQNVGDDYVIPKTNGQTSDLQPSLLPPGKN